MSDLSPLTLLQVELCLYCYQTSKDREDTILQVYMQELCAQDSKVGYSEETFKLRYGGVEKETSYDISS